jgi:hypothetical protein
MGLHEIQKLLYNKRNGFYIKEAAHRMGENHFQLYIIQGTDNKNIQVIQESKRPQNQKANEEMGK